MNIITKFNVGDTVFPIAQEFIRSRCPTCNGWQETGAFSWGVQISFMVDMLDVGAYSDREFSIDYWGKRNEGLSDHSIEENVFATLEEALEECVKRNQEVEK